METRQIQNSFPYPNARYVTGTFGKRAMQRRASAKWGKKGKNKETTTTTKTGRNSEKPRAKRAE